MVHMCLNGNFSAQFFYNIGLGASQGSGAGLCGKWFRTANMYTIALLLELSDCLDASDTGHAIVGHLHFDWQVEVSLLLCRTISRTVTAKRLRGRCAGHTKPSVSLGSPADVASHCSISRSRQ